MCNAHFGFFRFKKNQKFSKSPEMLVSMGKACAEPRARTPIGASGNFIFSLCPCYFPPFWLCVVKYFSFSVEYRVLDLCLV